jgi:cell shape-determining protein MreC
MDIKNNNRRSLFTGVAGGIITFILTAIATIFLFGRQIGTLRQELNDLVAWKREAAPQITRIDRSGSISFEHFHDAYRKEQAEQYEQLKELKKEVNHLESMNLRLDRLEQIVMDGQPKRERKP